MQYKIKWAIQNPEISCCASMLLDPQELFYSFLETIRVIIRLNRSDCFTNIFLKKLFCKIRFTKPKMIFYEFLRIRTFILFLLNS